MRIAALLKSPVPFHAPILEHLSQASELDVAYLSTSRANSSFDPEPLFPGRILGSRSRAIGLNDISLQLPRGIGDWLDNHRPDVALVHSFDPASMVVRAVLAHKGIPAFMWSESTEESGRVRGRLSEAYRTISLRSVRYHVTNGTRASEFIMARGVPRHRIFQGIYPVSPKFLVENIVARTPDPVPTMGFIGRLIESKQPGTFLAASNIVRNRLPLRRICVGSGPLHDQLIASEDAVDVEFPGFVSADGVQDILQRLDFLVLPSKHEVWGLVVNQALLAGVFVIVSDRVGSAIDLIEDGVTGTIVRGGDTRIWASAMERAVETVDRTGPGRQRRIMNSLEKEPRMADPAAFADSILAAASAAKESV